MRRGERVCLKLFGVFFACFRVPRFAAVGIDRSIDNIRTLLLEPASVPFGMGTRRINYGEPPSKNPS